MLGTALKVRHFGRYKDIALLIRKYARAGSERLDGAEDPDASPEGIAEAQALAADLERLGPTFIKLGQLLSTRPDLLPASHLDALARLQDKVEPFPYAQAEAIIEEELGARVNKIFRSLEPKPVAAASLAQLHRGVLRDGRVVAVKVQRPGLREVIRQDMAAIGEAALFLDRHTEIGRRYEFARILDEFRRGLYGELDYVQEALNLRALSVNLAQFDRLVVPAPLEDFSTARVLTMDYIPGRKITELTPLTLNELDGVPLADQLFRAYLKQILVDGFFHADPHPGNIVLAPDGRIAILDLGMVGRLGPDLQQNLLSLLLAVCDGRSDEAATIAIRIGRRRDGFAETDFRQKISRLVLNRREATISELNFGRIIFEIARVSGEDGLRLPPEMTMISKALLNLDQVVTTLDPGFQPAAVVRGEASILLEERLRNAVSTGGMTAGFLEAQKFAQRLPERLGKVLDVLGGNELRVKVDAVDEKLLIDGMQKIANRIALGVVLGSLIIGAALLMKVQTSFKIFEYPGLAILLFLGAAVASLVLIVDILYFDDYSRARIRGSEVEDRGD
jgi:predicted unusual protein kinase regulating ubiquinone biosynthesis (AarF/ABC1/UbiB family)